MKKYAPLLLGALFVLISFAVFKHKIAKKPAAEQKVVFAYFSGYRCPPCMVFEDEYLDNFKKTYKEKYNGRVELKVYKIDIPLDIMPDSPQYEQAKKLAKRNDDILKATSKMNNVSWVGSVPYAVIGDTSFDGFSEDTEVSGPNVERALKKALENNEITKIATQVSGKMQDYANIREAAKAGDFKAVQAFIKSGADVNEIDDSGNTALMSASFNGDEDIVKLLLAHGANINVYTKYEGTALGSAAFMGRREIVELLLSKGADIHLENMISAAGIDENMIRLLKKHGSDINGKLDDGNTPLTKVLTKREKRSGTKVALKYAGILINEGADVNLKVTIKDADGKTVTKTPLQLAQSREMKDFLISKGAK